MDAEGDEGVEPVWEGDPEDGGEVGVAAFLGLFDWIESDDEDDDGGDDPVENVAGAA